MESKSTQELAEALLYRYRYFIISLVLGILFLVVGYIIFNSKVFEGTKIEVLGTTEAEVENDLIIEISGAVEKPGVYKLKFDSRVDDLLVLAGGLSALADRLWVEKNINRALKLVDGQKVYIPNIGESNTGVKGSTSSTSEGNMSLSNKVNINSASIKELDSLIGIGEVRAQAIVENRPYRAIEELVSKKVLPKKVFDKLKDDIVAQ